MKPKFKRAIRAARAIKVKGQTPRRVAAWFAAIKEALRA